MAGRLEELKLAQLKRIVDATSAKVVLSTDWRRQAQLKRQVQQALKRLGIECVGATPQRAMFQPVRPQEITEWLQANGRDQVRIAVRHPHEPLAPRPPCSRVNRPRENDHAPPCR